MESHILKLYFTFVIILLSLFSSGLGSNSTDYDFKYSTNDFNHTIELDPSDIDQFIVGGTKAVKGDFPAQAALCLVTDSRTQMRCGSTIISRYHCVTAGHCVNGFENSPEKLIIIVGVTNVEHYDPRKDVYSIRNIWKHPKFKASLPPENDIAVCKVNGDFAEHGSLAPAPLPTVPPEVNQMCVTCGWGVATHVRKVISPDLMRVNMPIYESDSCAMRYYPQVRVDTVRSVCAGYQQEKSICYGDSGGPLYCNGRLVGVTSWGDTHCNGNYPSVFTNVYQFLDFIKECLKK